MVFWMTEIFKMASGPPSWITILFIILSNLIDESWNFAGLFHARSFMWVYIFRNVAFEMTEIFKMVSGPPSWNTVLLNILLKLLITRWNFAQVYLLRFFVIEWNFFEVAFEITEIFKIASRRQNRYTVSLIDPSNKVKTNWHFLMSFIQNVIQRYLWWIKFYDFETKRKPLLVLIPNLDSKFNPSRSKEFYNLVRPRGVKLPPCLNRYNLVGLEKFLTKLSGHVDKSITQIWVVKYFWNVTQHRYRWRLRRHIRLVMREGKFESISSDIRDKLHWLPIQQRIKFKIGVLVYRCLRGTAPPYLSEMLSAAADIAGRRSLRSAAHGDLVVPRSRTVRFGSRMFAVSGPTFWNSLTNELKHSSLIEPAFKKQLKTFLFRTV